jgi:flavin reductase (DIM6/NTAB) family NADH-FMN oxidoreductase RutF
MQVPTDYQTAVARKYPEPVVVAIARDEAGHDNPITLCWAMRASVDPPLIAIAIGLQRHSLAAIRHAREFVISILASDMAEDALFFGTKSGTELDKLAARGTKTQPATAIHSVLIADAVANFECRLEGELQSGDHVVFVGRVLAAHMNRDPDVRGLYALGNDRFGGVVPG